MTIEQSNDRQKTDNPDSKTQFVSFRISYTEFKRIEEYAKFLHEIGAIKAPTVPCLTRSILFTEINKLGGFLEERQQKIIAQERQAAVQMHNERMKQLDVPPLGL